MNESSEPAGVAVDHDVGRHATISVPTGGGAVHSIVNPVADPHLEWAMRYCMNRPDGNAEPMALAAAEVLASFDYLCGIGITMKEATRRLRLLRAAHRAALTPNAELSPPRPERKIA